MKSNLEQTYCCECDVNELMRCLCDFTRFYNPLQLYEGNVKLSCLYVFISAAAEHGSHY